MGDMRVAEVMTRDVRLIEPNQTIRDAARLMAEMDAGSCRCARAIASSA